MTDDPMLTVRSHQLTEGLFGQVLIRCLVVTPYFKKHALRPLWQVLSPNYGPPPDFDIFPEVLDLAYEPDRSDRPNPVLSLEELKDEIGHPTYSFHDDFQLANALFFEHFAFPKSVVATARQLSLQFANNHVLGLHYRGTDKNRDPAESNSVSQQLFLRAVRDFLQEHPTVDMLFVASDEASFVAEAQTVFDLPVISFQQIRSKQGHLDRLLGKDIEPLHKGHHKSQNVHMAHNAIVDALVMAECNYLLKSQSALSAWAKIFNPEIEAYRLSACKNDWFPDAFIPLYKSADPRLQAELDTVQRGELDAATKYTNSPSVASYLNA